jgi:hypothetical protein
VAFQSIGIPKSLKRYPSELVLVVGSSAKDESDAPKKIGSSSWLSIVLVIVLGVAKVTVYPSAARS